MEEGNQEDRVVDEDARADPVSRRRLDEIQAEYLSFNKRVMRILLGMGLLVVLCLAVEGFLIYSNSRRVSDIQASRLTTCNDTNDRNQKTLEKLNTGIDQAEASAPGPAQKAQIEQSRAFSTALINTLAPYRDCSQVVRGGGQS